MDGGRNVEGSDSGILKCCSLHPSSERDMCMYCKIRHPSLRFCAAKYVLLAPVIFVVKFSVVCLYLILDIPMCL